MTRKLMEHLSLHALLRQHILHKNREILKYFDNEELDGALDAIDEREDMVKLVNDVQYTIENTLQNNSLFHKKREWYQKTSQWINMCHKENLQILQGLVSLKNKLKKEVFNTHITRMKLQGYNLNKISRPSSSLKIFHDEKS